ncbi:Na+/H+ antiporter subunit D [Haematomicrobium sanguinis]|uniref:Na+/H+ antiporter subunit D n=1 Tax=Haematomicrobium sanguinis TaxID=479106 RepID=UPI00047DFE6E|nr:Na+/H+ antiporter subunit D [Haematomicrobium sanguinis]
MNIVQFAPLAVVLPFVGAALAFLLIKVPKAQRWTSIIVLTLTFFLEVALLVDTWNSGPQAVFLGGWAAPFGITMVVDQFSALLLVVSTVVSLSVLYYAVGQGLADADPDEPISIFHPTYLILVAGVSNAFLAGDLFNLYVGFEILLAASYVLMTLGGTSPRIRAGVTYVVVSVISSLLFLVAIAWLYAATGTINLADLALKIQELDPATAQVLHYMLLLAFGIKAAVFPLSFWLPDSYPTAPAPVTAVFAGLLTKVGVYAMIRTETLLFPSDGVNTLLMVLALLTMVVGILGAIAQSDIKRALSFTLVSHIGYMVFGMALANVIGLASTIFYTIHHITVQTSLFLVTGLIERRGGTANMDRLGGLAKLSPLLGVLYFIPAMNLAGIPPFSGFLGKVGIMEGGAAVGTWLAYVLIGASVVTSLLTLLVMARIWNRAFWRKPEDAEYPDKLLFSKDTGETKAMPASMVGPTIALVGAGLAFTVLAGPIFQASEHAAADMLERTPYIEAVLNPSNLDELKGGELTPDVTGTNAPPLIDIPPAERDNVSEGGDGK